MANVQEPFRPPANGALAFVVRTHDDNAAVLLRTHVSREYEAHELTEPFSELVERLHREGRGGWHGPIARREHRARVNATARIARLTAERDEARRAGTDAEVECDRLRAEVNRLRAV